MLKKLFLSQSDFPSHLPLQRGRRGLRGGAEPPEEQHPQHQLTQEVREQELHHLYHGQRQGQSHGVFLNRTSALFFFPFGCSTSSEPLLLFSSDCQHPEDDRQEEVDPGRDLLLHGHRVLHRGRPRHLLQSHRRGKRVIIQYK